MILSRLKTLAKDTRGALAAETAIALLVLSGLLMSGVEVTRYVMLHQKLERTSATVADLVSQAEALSESDFTELFAAAGYVADPFDIDGAGQVIVSGISKTSGEAVQVDWQRGSGSGSGASHFGGEGEEAVLPDGFTVNDGESIVVGEAFYDFTPMFADGVIDASTLYHSAILRPRFKKLTSIADD